MRQTRVKPAYYLVLVIYALIIGGLLYRQFGETRPVRYTLGEISISARQTAGVPGNLIPVKSAAYRAFSLKYRSFTLELPEGGAGVLVHSDGSETQAAVAKIDRSSSSLTVQLVSGISMKMVESKNPENSYTLTVDFSGVSDETVKGIRLPWTGSEASLHPGLPILRASRTGSSGGVIALGPYCRVADAVLSIPRRDDLQEIFFLNPRDDESLVALWFDIHQDLADRDSLEKILKVLAGTAYKGWNSERWLPAAGTWEYAADAPGEGTTAAAMLLESLYRGTFPAAQNRLVQGSPRLIDRKSALYLGSMVPPLKAFGSAVAGYAREAALLSRNNDPEIFSNPEYLSILFDAGLSVSYQLDGPLGDLAEKVILSDPGKDTELKLALNAGEYLLKQGDSGSPALRFLIRELLLPRICPIGEGRYGVALAGGSDTRVNVQAGMLMISSEDPLASRIGYTLLMSAAASAGEYGRIPASIEMSEFTTSESPSMLEPETFEELLRMFRESSYTPRAVSLGTGQGWMWTTAANVRYQAGNTAILSFQFPQGGIHHFAVFGVEPFDQIQMHGIPWKSDPEFQRYSDGWVYDAGSRTLYVKIRHRAARQEIRIIRNLLPAPAPAAAE